jgi:hypothetical protein
MKAILTVCCRELCNLLPTIYPTSRTQVFLAPTSTCYANCLNTRNVLNCFFRSKVMWWLQIILNYRPCFRNMETQATLHLFPTGTKISYEKIFSERLHNINLHFTHICLTIRDNNYDQNTSSVFWQQSDTITKTIPLHFVLHCISLKLSSTSESDLKVPLLWDQKYKLHVHTIGQMDTLLKTQ